MKVFILNPIQPIVDKIKASLNDSSIRAEIIWDTKPKKLLEVKNINTLEEKIIVIDPDFDSDLSETVLSKIHGLKTIILTTTGIDYIDTKYCKQNGIEILNTPYYSAQAVAEWSFMSGLALARNLALLIKQNFEADYRFIGTELKNKKAGILGLGNIGEHFANLAVGFGMQVQYWSRSEKNTKFSWVPVNELFASSDLLFISLEVNNETNKIISEKLLKGMPKSALLVTASGIEFNKKLVLRMVRNKQLGGFTFEGKSGEFLNHEGNVLAMPSMAWVTKESFNKNAAFVAMQIRNALKSIKR